jgi:hypothetical protein
MFAAGCGSTSDYAPEIDPANFISEIDNPFYTLTPGTSFTFEGVNEDGVLERVEIEITSETIEILGVSCLVVRDTVYENSELVEDTFDWFAQDMEGNVWYFGEDSKDYNDGEVVSTAGSWEAGVDGAQPGIIMNASPEVGITYRQEYYKGKAEDMAEVQNLNTSVSTPYGDFENCLEIKEWTPLEPGVSELKYHCPGVAYVVLEKMLEGGSGQLELIAVETE